MIREYNNEIIYKRIKLELEAAIEAGLRTRLVPSMVGEPPVGVIDGR